MKQKVEVCHLYQLWKNAALGHFAAYEKVCKFIINNVDDNQAVDYIQEIYQSINLLTQKGINAQDIPALFQEIDQACDRRLSQIQANQTMEEKTMNKQELADRITKLTIHLETLKNEQKNLEDQKKIAEDNQEYNQADALQELILKNLNNQESLKQLIREVQDEIEGNNPQNGR